MDYQILVNIAVGIVTLMGGWVFKMILGHVNEIKEEHHHLMVKHHDDIDKIKENYDKTKSPDQSVAFGLRTTASIITGAALIMVAVFGGFALGDIAFFQSMGFGLGAAVLLDATIVRSVLVPSVMKLLGDKAWYLPSWLNWIPNISIEGNTSSNESS